MSEQRLRGYCALCISRCGCISVVNDGVLTAVEPDPDHPTGHHLCLKGRAAPELIYSPDRLLQPMRRSRPKGEGDPGWQPISWDEALRAIAGKLHEIAAAHGPEAVAFGVTTPSGTAIADNFVWINRLAHAFGSPNTVFATENCNWHKDFAPGDTFGTGGNQGIGMADYAHSGCILLWGFNPATSWLSQVAPIQAAQRRGAKLVVVDPRRVGLANGADQWLALRPGSDGVLALALAGIQIEQGWFDQGFIRRWSNGPFLLDCATQQLLSEADLISGGATDRYLVWSEATQQVEVIDTAENSDNETASPLDHAALRGEFSLQTVRGKIRCRPAFDLYAEACCRLPLATVERLTAIPQQQLRDTAALLYHSRPLSYYTWTGSAQHANAAQSGRAIALLYALGGSLHAPGGNVSFTKPPLTNLFGLELLSDEQRQKTLGLQARPLGPGKMGWVTSRDLYRAVVAQQPYAVKALLNFGSNPLLTKPATRHAEEALLKLDFFVQCDLFINPSAQFADILLPVTTPWEHEGLCGGFQISQQADSWLQLRQPAIAPQGEARDDGWIVFELANRLGLGHHFFHGDREAALRHQLAPCGITPEQLRAQPGGIDMGYTTRHTPYREQGFTTPTRRLEIFSVRYAQSRYAPIPRFDPPAGGDERFPLRLTSSKWPYFCHSQHRNLPRLRARMPAPLVELHPQDAEARGIREGDAVVIRTPQATMRASARVTPRIARGVVCAQYGWWQPCHQLGLPSYAIKGKDNASYNTLLDGELFDPISSSNSLRSACCNIERG
ncbi:MAG: molybdopterin-dependent oxidoreductase [Gammaproteobacteria bacterium]|nr:molybdopterin-dependent oxidoreductase [Gammaproteobacteria bacterium]